MKISIKPPHNKSPVFTRPAFLLVGMMRSGSKLLDSQLNLLPDVRCHGELFNPTFTGFSHDGKATPPGHVRDDPGPRRADEDAVIAAVDGACDPPGVSRA